MINNKTIEVTLPGEDSFFFRRRELKSIIKQNWKMLKKAKCAYCVRDCRGMGGCYTILSQTRAMELALTRGKSEHRFDLEENKGQFENELVETNEKQ